MKRVIAALALALFAVFAQAGCRANDRWQGSDKDLHFVAGGLISAAVTMQTGSRWTGFAAGAGAGLVKEALDSTNMGDCTLQDLLVTVAGAGVGAYLGGLQFSHFQGRTLVSYSRSF
jgi:uncharacterized protein YfiM (DUF2279 family)